MHSSAALTSASVGRVWGQVPVEGLAAVTGHTLHIRLALTGALQGESDSQVAARRHEFALMVTDFKTGSR